VSEANTSHTKLCFFWVITMVCSTDFVNLLILLYLMFVEGKKEGKWK